MPGQGGWSWTWLAVDVSELESGVLRINGFEAVGFIAPVEFAVAQADDGEALGDAEAGAVPPVAADGSAGDVGDAAEADDLVDVGVALKDGEGIVLLQFVDDDVGVGDDHLWMAGGLDGGGARI